MNFRRKLKKVSLLFANFALVMCFQNCTSTGFDSSSGGSSSGSSSSSSSSPATGTLKSLTLAWDANTDASLVGYRIYYGLSSMNYSSSVDAQSPAVVDGAVSYQIPGLKSGQTYYFAVVAYDSNNNESPKSNEVIQLVQ